MLGVTGVYLLTLALRELPTGTGYAVFTGIGCIGAVSLGIVVHGDAITVKRLAAVTLIVAGVDQSARQHLREATANPRVPQAFCARSTEIGMKWHIQRFKRQRSGPMSEVVVSLVLLLALTAAAAMVVALRLHKRAVRRAEANLRTIFDTAPIGNAVVDREDRFVDANHALGQHRRLHRRRSWSGGRSRS